MRLLIAEDDPDIILADEPTGNLDRDTQKEIMDIFRDLANQGKCVILVSHSPDVAEMCDERYELVKISGKSRKKEIIELPNKSLSFKKGFFILHAYIYRKN